MFKGVGPFQWKGVLTPAWFYLGSILGQQIHDSPTDFPLLFPHRRCCRRCAAVLPPAPALDTARPRRLSPGVCRKAHRPSSAPHLPGPRRLVLSLRPQAPAVPNLQPQV